MFGRILTRTTQSSAIAGTLLLLALTVLYLPLVGHGFFKDDFGWVSGARGVGWRDVFRFFRAEGGFFRPVVWTSFAVNARLCGVSPFCYGLTNYVLLLGCAAGVFALARAMRLPAGVALFAAAVWSFNWHGIGVSVLWISGRTALLLVLFATWASAAMSSRRYALAGILCAAAMLSKEEGIVLPFLLVAAAFTRSRIDEEKRSIGGRISLSAAAALMTAAYLALRYRSGAFTPRTAPPFYQLSVSWERFAANARPYVDRSASCAIAIVILLIIVSGFPRHWLRSINRAVAAFGVMWWLAGFSITVFLPVRSSLYACFPSVGIVLAAAAVANAIWNELTEPQRRRVVVAGILLPWAVLLPVNRTRSRLLVAQAELSTTTLQALNRVAARGPGTKVVIKDDRTLRPSLDSTFGAGLQTAVDLMVTPRIVAQLDPPPTDAALAGLPPVGAADVYLELKGMDVLETR